MKFFIVLAVLAVSCSAHVLSKRSAQVPGVWKALKVLRGNKDLTVQEQQELRANAVPGKDYPINAVIPDKAVDCKSYHQPGFYVDDSAPSNCQVFVRCDDNGDAKSFLCPNLTLFNQITLVCDWFYNVDCKSSAQFADYSNSRLGDATAKLLDDSSESGESKASPEKPAKKHEKGKKEGRSETSEGNENTIAPGPAATEAATEAPTTAAAATEAATTAAAKEAATTAAAATQAATTAAAATEAATTAAAATQAATTAAPTETATTTVAATEAATTAAAATQVATTAAAATEAATTAASGGPVSVSGSASSSGSSSS